MGYRSQVCFGLTKKAKIAMLLADRSFSTETEKYAEKTELKDGSTLYDWGDVKWYPDFEEVQHDMAVFSFLDEMGYDKEYQFIRIGEEFGDIDEFGMADFYHAIQSIERI